MIWNFRIREDEETVFLDAMKKLGLTKSQFMKKSAIEYIEKHNTSKGNIKRLFLQIKAKNKIREHNSAMYIIRNCQRTIYNLGVASLFNMKELNIPMLCETIDNYVLLYNTFTKEQQELLKDDIEGLKMFKDRKFLREKFKSLEMLDFIKKDKR